MKANKENINKLLNNGRIERAFVMLKTLMKNIDELIYEDMQSAWNLYKSSKNKHISGLITYENFKTEEAKLNSIITEHIDDLEGVEVINSFEQEETDTKIEIKKIEPVKIEKEKYGNSEEPVDELTDKTKNEKKFKIKIVSFIILFILTPIVVLAIAWLGKGIIKENTIDFIIHWLFPLPIIVLYFMVMKSEAKIKGEKYEFRGKASGAFAAAIIIYLLSFIPRSNNSEPFDLTITIKSNDKEVYDNFNNNTLIVFFDNYRENPNAEYSRSKNHFEVEDIPPKYKEDSVSFQLNYNGYYIVDINNILVDENKKYSVNEKIYLRISRHIKTNKQLDTLDIIKKIISEKTIYDKKKDVLKIVMKDLNQEEKNILKEYKNVSRKKGNTTEYVSFDEDKDNESFVLTNSETKKPISTNIKKINVGGKENVRLSEKTINSINKTKKENIHNRTITNHKKLEILQDSIGIIVKKMNFNLKNSKLSGIKKNAIKENIIDELNKTLRDIKKSKNSKTISNKTVDNYRKIIDGLRSSYNTIVK